MLPAVQQGQAGQMQAPKFYFSAERGNNALQHAGFVRVSPSARARKEPSGNAVGTAKAIVSNLKKNPDFIYVGYTPIQGYEAARLVGTEPAVRAELANLKVPQNVVQQLIANAITSQNAEQRLAGELQAAAGRQQQERFQRTNFYERMRRIHQYPFMGAGAALTFGTPMPRRTRGGGVSVQTAESMGRGGVVGQLRKVMKDPTKVLDVSSLTPGAEGKGKGAKVIAKAQVTDATPDEMLIWERNQSAGNRRIGIPNFPELPIVSNNDNTWTMAFNILATISGDQRWSQFIGKRGLPYQGPREIPMIPVEQPAKSASRSRGVGGAGGLAATPVSPLSAGAAGNLNLVGVQPNQMVGMTLAPAPGSGGLGVIPIAQAGPATQGMQAAQLGGRGLVQGGQFGGVQGGQLGGGLGAALGQAGLGMRQQSTLQPLEPSQQTSAPALPVVVQGQPQQSAQSLSPSAGIQQSTLAQQGTLQQPQATLGQTQGRIPPRRGVIQQGLQAQQQATGALGGQGLTTPPRQGA